MSELHEKIAENAVQPAEASADGTSAKQHSLRDQIAADRYLASRRVRSNPFQCLRSARMTGPSAGGE